MSDEKHPIIDSIFDKLELGGRVGVELLIRGAKGTKRAMERSVKLLEEVGEYAEKRLEELDGEPERPPPKVKGDTTPHAPERGEDGVLRDETFSFLDRPSGELETPEE